MSETQKGAGDINMKHFFGVYKTLDAVKKCLHSEKYASLTEVQELLNIFDSHYLENNDKAVDRTQRKVFIVLEGMDASGKTTICRRLCGMLGGKKLCTPPEEMWGLREKFDRHPAELRRAYYALGNYLAACQVRETYNQQPVIMDRFWHSTAAYALAHDCADGKSELPAQGDPVYDWPADLLKPDVVFFLSVSEDKRIERLMNRKTKAVTMEELKMKDDKALRETVLQAFLRIINPRTRIINSSHYPKTVLKACTNTLISEKFVNAADVRGHNNATQP